MIDVTKLRGKFDIRDESRHLWINSQRSVDAREGCSPMSFRKQAISAFLTARRTSNCAEIVVNGVNWNIHHTLMRNFSTSSHIEMPSDIEILGSSCFSSSKSLSSISSESNSQLTQIESFAFSRSSLQSIVIPSTVQILGSSCFSYCRSLSSISFDLPSQLKRKESRALFRTHLKDFIPSAILFVAFDVILKRFQISIADRDSCPEFTR
jgi:hypothetical protein